MYLKKNSIYFVIIVAMFCSYGICVAQVQDSNTAWQISLDAGKVKLVTQGASNTDSDNINANFGVIVSKKNQNVQSSAVDKIGAGLVFEVKGRVSERVTKKWSLALENKTTKSFQYYAMRYKAKGICRDDAKFGIVVLTGKDASGKAVSQKLIDCTQVINDDKWHVAICKNGSKIIAQSLEIEVSTNNSESSFAIDHLEFSNNVPVVNAAEWDGSGCKSKTLCEVDITKLCNETFKNIFDRTLAKYGIVTDAADFHKAEKISVNGIPFRVRIEGNDIATSPEDASVYGKQVDFLGHKVSSKYFFPPSRNDVLTIPVAKNVSEAFFILVTEFPSTTRRYGGIPDVPFYFDDVEMFSIELVYASGESETAFPYSIFDQGYVIRRSAGVYAVPVDNSRKLMSIVAHNRFFGGTVSIAAVTLNSSEKRIFPSLTAEPVVVCVPELPKPSFRKAFIEQKGNRIIFGNSFYELVVNCNNGLSIEKLVNRWSQKIDQAVDVNSGIQIVIGGQKLTGRDFTVEKIDIDKNSANAQLQSKAGYVPLRLSLRFTVDDTPQLVMNLSVTNASKSVITPELKFPLLENVRIGSTEDNWIFFPQYRNVITNQTIYNKAANDHCFPLQFFDIYNHRAGIGLALITHNLNYAPLNYSLAKTEKGVSGFVQYPPEFYAIEPNQTMSCTETTLVFHHGDWHQAMSVYRDWLKTFYTPVPGNREWFSKTALLKDYFLGEQVAWQDLKTPPMFNGKEKIFHIDEFFSKDKEYWSGLSPDVIHFFRWFHIDQNDGKHYGEGNKAFGEYGYDNYGGLEKFKSGLTTIQNKFKIPVSLYFVPDRCSSGSAIGSVLGSKAAVVRADGSKLVGDNISYNCAQQKEWQDFMVEITKKVQRETGADCIYLDVFGTWHTSGCYSKEHGHRVPSWYAQTTNDLIKRIRQELPPNVVLWTEFPLTDLNAQYVDGNIHYYFLTLHETFVRSYDILDEQVGSYTQPPLSVYRYVFPHIKQVDLPGGNDFAVNGINRFKTIFFNGDAFYDNGWFVADERTRKELLARSISIMQKFSDCFSSENVTPLVKTERQYVYANEFAGKDKTVWTLYNGRYNTVRGKVLAVEHKKGAVYYDAWNDKPITPQIVKGKAIISQKLDPQALGCIVQYEKP